MWYTNTSLVSDPHAIRSPPPTLKPTKFFSLTCPSSTRAGFSPAAGPAPGARVAASRMARARTSQTHMVLSVDAETSSFPELRKRTYDVALLCPESTATASAGYRRSNRCTRWSAHPTASARASFGPKRAQHTLARTSSSSTDASASVDHTLTLPSSEPLASNLASARQKSTVQARLSCSSNSHTAVFVSASHTVTTPS